MNGRAWVDRPTKLKSNLVSKSNIHHAKMRFFIVVAKFRPLIARTQWIRISWYAHFYLWPTTVLKFFHDSTLMIGIKTRAIAISRVLRVISDRPKDRPTDRPTDRQSSLWSRVHATKRWKRALHGRETWLNTGRVRITDTSFLHGQSWK